MTYRWYQGITRYQWLVLVVASLGWVFDVFEGQVFVASMREAMPSLVDKETEPGQIDFLNKVAMGSFLVGGALGGVLFGALSDRMGRARTLAITILVYSFFTFVTAFAQTPWQMIALRFVVALGTGGEWAVGAAFVAEVFPKRSRPWMGSIFHGSSVLGSFLAVAAGAYVVGNPEFGWRWGFALGALPALLVVWIRRQVREPDRWLAARGAAESAGPSSRAGRIRDLFSAQLVARTVLGVALATTGLATFWGVHIFGKNVTLHYESRAVLAGENLTPRSPADLRARVLDHHASRLKNAEMLGMFLTTLGGGIGLVGFGAVSDWLGRRGAFVFYYAGGFIATLVMFRIVHETGSWLTVVLTLPVFGFFTLGMHAGYAVYFPELYPTRLRSSGSGFCFNVARLTAAPILVLTAFLQKPLADGGWGWSNERLASWMSLLFLAGALLSLIAPETKGTELPE